MSERDAMVGTHPPNAMPECFQPTKEAQRVLDLLTAMLREERRRAYLAAQEACAEVGRRFQAGRSSCGAEASCCVEAIAKLESQP